MSKPPNCCGDPNNALPKYRGFYDIECAECGVVNKLMPRVECCPQYYDNLEDLDSIESNLGEIEGYVKPKQPLGHTIVENIVHAGSSLIITALIIHFMFPNSAPSLTLTATIVLIGVKFPVHCLIRQLFTRAH